MVLASMPSDGSNANKYADVSPDVEEYKRKQSYGSGSWSGARPRNSNEHVDVTTDGDTEFFFDEDGNVLSAEAAKKKAAREQESTGDIQMSPEEWLIELGYDEAIEFVDEQVNELPGTREELMERTFRKVFKELKSRGIDPRDHVDVPSSNDSTGIVETLGQKHQLPKEAATEGVILGGEELAECPKCGTEDITASTIEKQTKGADESGTQFTKTSCGCTLRHSD